MSFLPLNELPALFPHVVSWISYLEKPAQESGRALSSIEFNLAQHVGLAHPEGVRILSIPRIPLPAYPRVKQLAKQVGLLTRILLGDDHRFVRYTIDEAVMYDSHSIFCCGKCVPHCL
jgi:hypothetical protein